VSTSSSLVTLLVGAENVTDSLTGVCSVKRTKSPKKSTEIGFDNIEEILHWKIEKLAIKRLKAVRVGIAGVKLKMAGLQQRHQSTRIFK